jgi:cathepsin B
VHGSKDLLSPTDTLACCSGMACGFSQGCNGGQPAGAWSFFASQGIVSGGLFEEVGAGESCLPYPFLTCAHHVEPTEELPACPAEDFETPKCKHSCSEEGFEKSYGEDKLIAKVGYAVRARVEDIQKDIMENGPVSAAFTVYQDFLAYSGEGVYQHVTGAPLGGHAVK